MIISDCMLVPMVGDVDITTAPGLRHHLDRLIAGGCKRIILDMDKVRYVDSTGMALILAASKALRRQGGLLSLINVDEGVMHGFVIGRLCDFIPCAPVVVPQGNVVPLAPGTTPKWRLTIRIVKETLGAARDRLTEMLESLPLEEDQVLDLVLAAGEAMGNCVTHTPEGTGFMTVAAYPDRVVIETVDDGPGFSLAADEEPQTTLLHGRGIKIMRLLCDSVDIQKRPGGHGTIARLVKLFDGPSRPAERLFTQALSA